MKKKPAPKISGVSAKKKFVSHIPSEISFSVILKSAWLPSLISVFIVIILFAFRKISNYDLGFHLNAGRWIIENMAFPVKDVFTFTVNSHDYIDIQWLYQVLMFSVEKFSGYTGLAVINSLAIFTVFFLMLKRNNLSGVSLPVSIIFMIITAVCIQIRFSYRPEIWTWIFILLTLIILDRNFYSNKSRLYMLPVIMLLWVNMHGLFILGFVIMISYLLSGYVRDKTVNKKLLQWTGVSAAVVFINPYFSEGVMFPFYLFTRLQKENIFQINITELQSPWTMTGTLQTELYIYYSFAVISFALIFITLKHRKFHEFALLSAFFYLSFSSYRNIPLFMIYAFFIISVSVSDIIRGRNIEMLFNGRNKLTHILSYSITFICILISLRIFTGAYFLPFASEIKTGSGPDILMMPEKAADFINYNNFKGNIFNNLEFGGWLGWKTGQKVFIDGRLEVIMEDFYKIYLSSFSGNKLNEMLAQYSPGLIVNDISFYKWTGQLVNNESYSLAYWDGISAVYANNKDTAMTGNFNFASGLINENIDTNVFSGEEKNKLLASVKIRDFSDWLRGFYTEMTDPVFMINMGNFAFDNNKNSYAEILYLNYIKAVKGSVNMNVYKDLFLNLGSYYETEGDFERAAYCLSRYLEIFPAEADVSNRLNKLKRKRQ
ncbi:MAG TPA: hypothetical protein PL089_14650 [Ignavibacteria bacterium]|mgnify:CR=1 FL=1|nr:hypothetical protein [Ignavibacteria bacterium]